LGEIRAPCLGEQTINNHRIRHCDFLPYRTPRGGICFVAVGS
jgi:hypothetical protein